MMQLCWEEPAVDWAESEAMSAEMPPGPRLSCAAQTKRVISSDQDVKAHRTVRPPRKPLVTPSVI
jgi:hypothetical protein